MAQASPDATATEPPEPSSAAGEPVENGAPSDDEDHGATAPSGRPAADLGASLHEKVEAEAKAAEEEQEPHPLEAIGATPITPDDLAETAMHVCPFCEGWGAVEPEGLLAALPDIVARLEPFKQSTRYRTCDGCDGWGAVLTGSRMPEAGVQPCPDCEGRGYISADLAPIAPPPPANGDTAPIGADFVPPPDPMRTPPPQGQPPAVGMEWNPQTGFWEYPSRS